MRYNANTEIEYIMRELGNNVSGNIDQVLTVSDMIQIMRLQEDRKRNKILRNIKTELDNMSSIIDSIPVPEEITTDGQITDAIYAVSISLEKLNKEG